MENNKRRSRIRLRKRKRERAVLLVVIGLVLFSCLFFCVRLLMCPKITLNGKSDVSINYKTKYKELGFKAEYKNKNITKDVKVSGKVNTKKLGTYIITYKIGEGLFSSEVKRIVRVRDLKKPTITLPTSGDIYVCKDSKYRVEKYRAYDNYDGDLTKKVKVKATDTNVSYSVIDTSGNIKTIFRKIIYKDKEDPKITLKGENPTYLFVGDTYSEAGYIVDDNCDKNLSNSVKVSGDVDTSKSGAYVVTYKVSDSGGNNGEIKRKVIVLEKNSPGVIFLTFDDGPKRGTTDVILDILKEENVKATFFVTNGGPDDLIKREYDEGHTVGLHTASHYYPYLYSSVDAYFEDLNTVEQRVFNITGYHSKTIRFPGGSSNTVSKKYSPGIMSTLTTEVLNRGFKYYDWNLSSGDAGEIKTADGIYNNVTSHLSHDKVNMILMHDIKPYTRDALKRIIEYAKNNGYTFSKIDEYTEMVTQKVNN